MKKQQYLFISEFISHDTIIMTRSREGWPSYINLCSGPSAIYRSSAFRLRPRSVRTRVTGRDGTHIRSPVDQTFHQSFTPRRRSRGTSRARRVIVVVAVVVTKSAASDAEVGSDREERSTRNRDRLLVITLFIIRFMHRLYSPYVCVAAICRIINDV